MTTRSQSTEIEKQTQEAEKQIREILTVSSQRQEILQKQSHEQWQEARAQIAQTEARFDEILQMIMAMSLQNQTRNIPGERTTEATRDNGETSMMNTKNGWGKSTRLELPKFDGDGFDGWIVQADYFFEVAEVPEKERVRVAALHLENKALQWHIGYINMRGENAYDDWNEYIQAITACF